MWGNSSLHSLFWMTAQCLRASQEGQDVFSQQRPPHIYALVKGKQGDKRFSLPSSVSAPAYRFLYLSTIGLPSRVFLSLSLSVLKITILSLWWLLPLKQLDPTAVWHIPTPVANRASCRGLLVYSLKGLHWPKDVSKAAIADSLPEGVQPRTRW